MAQALLRELSIPENSDTLYSAMRLIRHNMENGWYLFLEDSWVTNLRISTDTGVVRFHQAHPETGTVEEIFSIHTLTGQNRETNAVSENRFILHKGEQVIYAARLEVASGALSISREDLVSRFRLDGQA